jgi:hypothetical protein
MNAITLGNTCYPVADTAVMRSSHVIIQDTQAAILPLNAVLYNERLTQLQLLLSKAYYDFQENSARTLTRFKLLKMRGLQQLLAEVEAEPFESEAQRQEQLLPIISEAQLEVRTPLAWLASDAEALRKAIYCINRQAIPDVAKPVHLYADTILEAEQRQLRLAAALEHKQEAIADITRALSLFKEKKLIDIFKDMLPTPDDVRVGLNLLKKPASGADGELINGAVTSLKKHLDTIGQARDYTSLVDVRDQLVRERRGLENESVELNRRTADLQRDQGLYRQVPQAWAAARAWAAQASLIVKAYEGFEQLGLAEQAADSSNYPGIEQAFRDMKAYIDSVQYDY